MSLLKTIKDDLHVAMKAKDRKKADRLRFLLGELQRGATKNLADEEIISKFKKLKATLMEWAKYDDEALIALIDTYLPQMASENELKEFIKDIDFSTLKNEMQAISIVKKHFGPRADGDLVKSLVLSRTK